MVEQSDALLAMIGDKNLVLRFFVTFSRFEFAMKRCGCFKEHPKKGTDRRAEPDWDALAERESIKNQLLASPSEVVLKACEYLLKYPPQSEMVRCKQLKFVATTRNSNESEVRYVLRLVQKVRNNLFHGGKFPNGPIPDAIRNDVLLKSCIDILYRCLILDDEISACFHQLG